LRVFSSDRLRTPKDVGNSWACRFLGQNILPATAKLSIR